MIRKQLDRLFSRKMLGSVLIGSSLGKIIEWTLTINLSGAYAMRRGWIAVFIGSVTIFLIWELLERRVDDYTDEQLEKLDDLHSKIDEVIDD